MARIIKRYENRKLYDTEDGKHVSLEDVARLIQSGSEVKVIDNTNGDDITEQTLTQIILDQSRQGKSVFSSDLLHNVIRWGGDMLDEGLDQVKHRLDEIMPKAIHRMMPASKNNEIDQLKDRVESLESMINQLVDEDEQSSNRSSS